MKKGSFTARLGFASHEPDLCDSVGSAIAFGMQFENDSAAQNGTISAGYAHSSEFYFETRAFGYILLS